MATLSTGQVAKASGVNIQTVGFYEREGLLAIPRRSASGYRQYSEDAVRIVSFIKRAQELGFTLREAKELRRLRSAGPKRAVAAKTAAELAQGLRSPCWRRPLHWEGAGKIQRSDGVGWRKGPSECVCFRRTRERGSQETRLGRGASRASGRRGVTDLADGARGMLG